LDGAALDGLAPESDVSAWFAGLPSGLRATIVSIDDVAAGECECKGGDGCEAVVVCEEPDCEDCEDGSTPCELKDCECECECESIGQDIVVNIAGTAEKTAQAGITVTATIPISALDALGEKELPDEAIALGTFGIFIRPVVAGNDVIIWAASHPAIGLNLSTERIVQLNWDTGAVTDYTGTIATFQTTRINFRNNTLTINANPNKWTVVKDNQAFFGSADKRNILPNLINRGFNTLTLNSNALNAAAVRGDLDSAAFRALRTSPIPGGTEIVFEATVLPRPRFGLLPGETRPTRFVVNYHPEVNFGIDSWTLTTRPDRNTAGVSLITLDDGNIDYGFLANLQISQRRDTLTDKKAPSIWSDFTQFATLAVEAAESIVASSEEPGDEEPGDEEPEPEPEPEPESGQEIVWKSWTTTTDNPFILLPTANDKQVRAQYLVRENARVRDADKQEYFPASRDLRIRVMGYGKAPKAPNPKNNTIAARRGWEIISVANAASASGGSLQTGSGESLVVIGPGTPVFEANAVLTNPAQSDPPANAAVTLTFRIAATDKRPASENQTTAAIPGVVPPPAAPEPTTSAP
jgi:hypothetical protein